MTLGNFSEDSGGLIRPVHLSQESPYKLYYLKKISVAIQRTHGPGEWTVDW